MFTQMKAIGAGVALALTFLLGLGLGWKIWKPLPRVVETATPAIRQEDHSLMLGREPDAKAKPKQILPAGTAAVERVGWATIQPHAAIPLISDPSPGLPGRIAPLCPPVTLDWTLTRMKDGTRRMVVSSPDGTVTQGVDIPAESAAPPRVLSRATGLSVYPKACYGIWHEQDFGFARVGAEVRQERGPDLRKTWDGGLRLGVTW